MSNLAADIREHMHVHSSDDQHIGRVDRVVGEKIELAKLDVSTGFKHRYIPLDWIAVIEGENSPQPDRGRSQGALDRRGIAAACR